MDISRVSDQDLSETLLYICAKTTSRAFPDEPEHLCLHKCSGSSGNIGRQPAMMSCEAAKNGTAVGKRAPARYSVYIARYSIFIFRIENIIEGNNSF